MNEHRFNHNFEDSINPLCLFSLEVESTAHFFLHCHNSVLNSIICDINNFSGSSLTKLILYGNPKFSFQQNSDFINASIEYISYSERYSC